MDRKVVAKELRQRLFDFIEAERRDALQDAAIDDLFESVLAKYETPKPFLAPYRPASFEITSDGLCRYKTD